MAKGKGKTPRPGVKMPPDDSRRNPPKPIHEKVRVSFEYYEDGTDYCLSRCNAEQIRTFLRCLRKLTERTWQQLREGTSKDPAKKTGLNPTLYAKSDLKTVPWPARLSEDVAIIGVRATDRRRVFGASVDQVFSILWFDEGHEIVPI